MLSMQHDRCTPAQRCQEQADSAWLLVATCEGEEGDDEPEEAGSTAHEEAPARPADEDAAAQVAAGVDGGAHSQDDVGGNAEA